MPPSDPHRAAAALRAAHDDPLLHARDWAARGRPVVGYVGADTPVELITAAGALPVRLTGRPGRDTRRARTYLDGAVDPHTVNLLAGLLDPEGPAPDLLVLTHDCDASVQLFHTLRELRRIRAEELPPFHFADLLHLPGEATRRYNLRGMRRLADQLGAWRGGTLTPAELEEAVAAHNTARAARRELRARRAAELSGADALRWYIAGTVMPPGLYARTLTEALSAPLTPPPGRPLFLSGSAHDTAAVYDTLEAGGWRVVGDDHDSGDSADQPPVAAPTLEGLADHYTREVRPATARTARERAGAAAAGVKGGRAEAFLCYCRRHDDAHRWDFPAQRAAARVPSALLHDQPYGEIDTTGLDALSDRPATEVAP